MTFAAGIKSVAGEVQVRWPIRMSQIRSSQCVPVTLAMSAEPLCPRLCPSAQRQVGTPGSMFHPFTTASRLTHRPQRIRRPLSRATQTAVSASPLSHLRLGGVDRSGQGDAAEQYVSVCGQIDESEAGRPSHSEAKGENRLSNMQVRLPQ